MNFGLQQLQASLLPALLLAALASAAAEPGNSLSPGLIASATDGQRRVVFIAPTPHFTLKENQSIHPQVKPQFKAEWNGSLSILRAGSYTFTGDARVIIAGQDADGRTIQLQAGEQLIRIEYERKGGGVARFQLQWESDHFGQEPVPAKVLGHRAAPAEAAQSASLARGRELVEELNCIACHKTETKFVRGRPGPDLSQIGSRAATNWVFHWLADPRKFRSDAVMPVSLLSAQERADVMAYLAGLKAPKADEKDAVSGNAQQGKTLFNEIGCAGCHDHDNAPLEGMGSKMPAAALARYLENPLVVDASGRMPHLAITSKESGPLANHLVQSRNADFEKPVPAGDARRGRELVLRSGCVNCHAITEAGKKLASTLKALPFNQLSAGKGCLAGSPSGPAPRYQLSAEQRGSLAAYLTSPDISEAPVQDFARLVKQFNCRACHELNGPAKLAIEINLSPPSLTDAGNKLRQSWLEQVMNKQKRVRPWAALRMPHYGPANVVALVQLFAAQAGAEPGEGAVIPPASVAEIQDAGKIVGKGAGELSCIGCHDFRGAPSGGEMRGPDMTEMYARVRADWLKRWLRDPGRIREGTAMPAFFGDLPKAQTEKIINQIVVALSAGGKMPIPEGLAESAQEYLVLVKDEPVTFRTFLQDSSPRTIAVGLPGSQNFCFDAEACRLNYAWAGDFLDVKPVWANRGGQQARILGTKYYTAPDICPIRVGDPDRKPSVKFRGYKLANKLPEFMYEVDGVQVHERITKASSGNGLTRSFQVGPAKQDVWFIAGPPEGVTISSSAGPLSNGRLRLPPAKSVAFDITILAGTR